MLGLEVLALWMVGGLYGCTTIQDAGVEHPRAQYDGATLSSINVHADNSMLSGD